MYVHFCCCWFFVFCKNKKKHFGFTVVREENWDPFIQKAWAIPVWFSKGRGYFPPTRTALSTLSTALPLFPLLCPTPAAALRTPLETWSYKSSLSHLWAQAAAVRGVKEVNKTQGLPGDPSPSFWKAGRLGALVTPASSQLQCSHSGSLEFSTGNRNSLKWEVHPANVSVLDGCYIFLSNHNFVLLGGWFM